MYKMTQHVLALASAYRAGFAPEKRLHAPSLYAKFPFAAQNAAPTMNTYNRNWRRLDMASDCAYNNTSFCI
jgi:hypothetical protein